MNGVSEKPEPVSRTRNAISLPVEAGLSSFMSASCSAAHNHSTMPDATRSIFQLH
jgi:cytochrome c peroxidase